MWVWASPRPGSTVRARRGRRPRTAPSSTVEAPGATPRRCGMPSIRTSPSNGLSAGSPEQASTRALREQRALGHPARPPMSECSIPQPSPSPGGHLHPIARPDRSNCAGAVWARARPTSDPLGPSPVTAPADRRPGRRGRLARVRPDGRRRLTEWGAEVIKIEHPETGRPLPGPGHRRNRPDCAGGRPALPVGQPRQAIGRSRPEATGRSGAPVAGCVASADVFVTNLRADPAATTATRRRRRPDRQPLADLRARHRVRRTADPTPVAAATTPARTGRGRECSRSSPRPTDEWPAGAEAGVRRRGRRPDDRRRDRHRAVPSGYHRRAVGARRVAARLGDVADARPTSSTACDQPTEVRQPRPVTRPVLRCGTR